MASSIVSSCCSHLSVTADWLFDSDLRLASTYWATAVCVIAGGKAFLALRSTSLSASDLLELLSSAMGELLDILFSQVGMDIALGKNNCQHAARFP